MRCEDLQFDLSLPFDGLPSHNREVLDAHLATCPLCRQRASDLRELSRDLGALSRPELPPALLTSIRATVSDRLGARNMSPAIYTLENRKPWSQKWLVPSTIGAFASVLFGMTFLWSLMMAGGSDGRPAVYVRGGTSDPSVLLAPGQIGDGIPLSSLDYAIARRDVGGESPSLNPNGALVALTRSLVRGEMKDDEVVVVADVFGNGLAQIAEVIEPSRDRLAVGELDRALRSDPSYAPFVPANMDLRSDSVRVVLKIQNVSVSTRQIPRRKV